MTAATLFVCQIRDLDLVGATISLFCACQRICGGRHKHWLHECGQGARLAVSIRIIDYTTKGYLYVRRRDLHAEKSI